MVMSTKGRPSSFRAEYCRLAHNYCLLGATKAQLAEFFGVTSRTIDNWLVTIPEFRDEVQRGRNIADAKVADSLYRRAVGYEHEVEGVFGRPGQMQVVRYKKCYPPQTEACVHWLRNRRPQNWGGRLKPARQKSEQAVRPDEMRVPIEQRAVTEPAPIEDAKSSPPSPAPVNLAANRCEKSPEASATMRLVIDLRATAKGTAGAHRPGWRLAVAPSRNGARAPPALYASAQETYSVAVSEGRTAPWRMARHGRLW
jgi:hypothetical protein